MIWRLLRRLGLWSRMALTLTAGFALLLFVFFGLANRALEDSMGHVRRERLLIAQMTAAAIDNVLAQAVRELQAAPAFADFDPASPNLAQEAEVLSNTYGRIGSFTTGVAFLDATGTVVLSYPPDLYPPGTSLADRPHVQQVLTTGRPAISDPFREPRGGRPVVAIAVPIQEPGKGLRGALLGLLDLHSAPVVEPLKRAATLGVTGHAVLLDRQARVMASTWRLPFLEPGEHAPIYRQALQERRSMVVTAKTTWPDSGNAQPHPHLMAIAMLERAPWAVAVGGDAEDLLEGVNRLRSGLLVIGLITLVVIWVATLFGTRLLVRPVHRLTQAAQAIAAGNLETPLVAPEGGEIGAMAAALEAMRRQLLHHIEALARWNERLEAEVKARTATLERQQAHIRRLYQQVLRAQEEERSRIARELHDEIGQTLTALRLALDEIARYLPPDSPGHARLAHLKHVLEQSIADLRRLITALRPGILDQLGLVPAVRWMADQTLAPLDIAVHIQEEGRLDRLPPEVETVLFRIAQEGMTNIARHSGAQHAWVRFRREPHRVVMVIEDDGRGFEVETLAENEDPPRGLGLAGMQERAALLGGTVKVTSAPGQGTRVEVIIPLSHEGEAKPDREG